MEYIIALCIVAGALCIAFYLGYMIGDETGQTKALDWVLEIEQEKYGNELLSDNSRRGPGAGEET